MEEKEKVIELTLIERIIIGALVGVFLSSIGILWNTFIFYPLCFGLIFLGNTLLKLIKRKF